MSEFEVTFDLQQPSIDATFEINATIPPALNDLTNVTITSPTNGQALTYNSNTQKWNNTTITHPSATWGSITGTISNQTDLQNVLDGKQPNLTSANAGEGISITGSGSNVVISNTQTSAEWGNITGTLSDQTDLQDALDTKQETLIQLSGLDVSSTEYTKLEYIESNGTQRIDIGVSYVANDILQSECDIAFTAIQTSRDEGQFFGIGASAYFGVTPVGDWSVCMANSPTTIGTRADTNRHQWVMKTKIGGTQSVYLSNENNVTYVKSRTTNPGNFNLFSMFVSGQNFPCDAKLYGCKLWQNGVLVRNFIPVKRNSDGIVGLYDLVNSTFYSNNWGSTNFTAGPTISSGLITVSGATNSLCTKNFLEGKVVAILGDSISTQLNKNVPEITIESKDVGVSLSAYATYYDIGTTIGGHTITSSDVGTQLTFTPVSGDVGKVIGVPLNYNTVVSKVWWEIMEDELGCEVIPVCWSGSSICSHESSSDIRKTAHAWHDAQIRKCGKRVTGSMERVAPDVIIIYRGCNDMTHTPYALLTDNYFSAYNWTYPTTDVITGGYGFKEGLALTIKKLRATYPNTQIMIATQNVFKRINYANFPTNNGLYSLPKFNDTIREVADFFGCQTIDFDKDGITFENCYLAGYITDDATIPTHPSTKGHALMGIQAIKDITNKLNINNIEGIS